MPHDTLPPEEIQVRADLKNLLRFAEQLIATRDRVVFDVAEYPVCITEQDLLGQDGAPLPGVVLGPAEDVWLSFARLQERRPPAPPAELAPWLRLETRSTPARPPSLLADRIVQVTAEEASDLIEAALVKAEAIAETPDSNPKTWSVQLCPGDLPVIVAALASYVKCAWRAWSAEEAPRRESIKLYETLYKAHAEIGAAGGEAGRELVLGLGLARWRYEGRRVNLPLIEQRAEFELDEADGALSIVPRNVPPAPALAPFLDLGIADAANLQREMAERLERVARDPDLAFGPFQPSSFRGVLETCAARLDASGTVLPPEEELGAAGDGLRISPTLCVIVRPRRDDILRADMRHMADALGSLDGWLPETARRFVVPLSDLPPAAHGGGDTDVGWTEDPRDRTGPRSGRLFFPLPANEEQEEIAHRLEEGDVAGVVVQGPPGTGKTHTIANIIGHSMAMGRRVLVAAHTGEALGAIRDKLPEALQHLAIAVTHSDREGARHLEQAVAALADRAQGINPRETRRQAEDRLLAIDQVDGRLAEIDAALAAVAQANMTKVAWRGAHVLPHVVAAWTASQGDRHAWFPDRLDLAPEFEPRFNTSDIAEAQALRRHLGEDIQYRADSLPSGSRTLPGLAALVGAHRALRNAEQRREQEREGNLPLLDLAASKTGEIPALHEWLERLAGWRDACTEHSWMPAAWEALAGARQFDGDGLRSMLEEAAALATRGEAIMRHAPALPEVVEFDRVADALANLAAGRKPFGIFGRFGHSPVRDAVEAARLAGEPPGDAASWTKIAALHTWRRDVRGFAARWNALAVQHGLSRLPEDPAASREASMRLGRSAADMMTLLTDARSTVDRLRVLFPYGLEAEAVVLRMDVALALACLRANMGGAELGEAEQLRASLREVGAAIGGRLGEALCQVAEGLGTLDLQDDKAAAQWRLIQSEVDRLAGLRAELRRLAELAALIRGSGASNWAALVEQQPAAAQDPVLPADWLDAWDHARALGFLARINDRCAIQDLTRERSELAAARERHFLNVIELLTYLGLRDRLTESVQAALRQFLAALSRLPKTAGAKTAARQRRILRDSLQRAVKAIPCWIMPEWRVAEQLPPELGSFDLVVIDEASQSNIMALPVVLRGKKLLIVGDDRQVSPVAVGMDDAAISRLRITYLVGQPLADHFDPATSLYELGGMMYPGKVIVLREHFRCVEPIIRFSSQFYGGRLLPLRLPKASERIDPPLVDILVENGQRRGDVNPAEAELIVDEIKRTIADPILNAGGKRSIGVISLHAEKQAKLIYDRLIQDVGPEQMSDHRIMCGDAATFQGQERDIVLLSMVHDSTTASKQSSRLYEQRYNVALSRARDRMVLVRSVTPSMLKDGDIKLEVLRHFQNPMAGGRVGQSGKVLALCESGFERSVGKRLIDAGYRLRAQVPAGGYRIDFVVEGANDCRLAIELDGDSFHGPERWAQDVRRQKALERLGWTFWRCWASEWEADKDAVFRDLVEALQRQGIEPIGATAVDGSYVEYRVVRRGAEVQRHGALETPRSAVPDGSHIFDAISADAVEALRARSPAFSETHPPLATSSPPPMEPSRTVANDRIEPGDTATVRFADGKPQAFSVTIVSDGPSDGRSRILPTAPLAQAILGLRTEDEIEVEIAGKLRVVVVEEVRKALRTSVVMVA